MGGISSNIGNSNIINSSPMYENFKFYEEYAKILAGDFLHLIDYRSIHSKLQLKIFPMTKVKINCYRIRIFKGFGVKN